ncbi:hypothetical protein [Paludisphaera soli]|uniref:hypothetical protein n=1 Tax=Paludisphaera soli TaxID=2712865 RepID=UPI0013EBB8AB|nr:hypothetical protein [Paludisphaera soli]
MKSRRFLIAAFLMACSVGQPGCGAPDDESGGATAVPSAGAAPAGAAAANPPTPPKTSSKAKEAPTEVYD